MYAFMMSDWFAWNGCRRILTVTYAFSAKLPVFMISDCLHRLDALWIQMYPRCMVEVFLACRGLIG